MVSALAIKASAKRTRRGSSGLYFHMPHPTPRWGPKEVFFGRCLQDEAGENRSFICFPGGLGEMSSFVSHFSYKTCGFLAPQGASLQLPSPAQPPFPLVAIPGWW